MSDWGWILAGGAAVTGFLGAFWGYIKSLWGQLASRVVVSCEIRGGLTDAMGMYFWQNFKVSRFGFRTYTGCSMYVRPVKRVQLIAMEVVGHAGRLYWRGWRPLWLSRIPPGDKGGIYFGNQFEPSGMKLTFIRGMFDIDRLLMEATTRYNHFRAATEGSNNSRYRVVHFFGTAGKPASLDRGPTANSACQSNDSKWDTTASTQHRVLQWRSDDLGTSRVNHGNALAQQALSPEAKLMIEEVRRWKTSEDWYKRRGIPWRRGWLLHGPPGTGKTSLIRAVAEDFDLPIFVFDLATFYNDEFQASWQKMLECVPCIALIEDIDAVFDGRENKVGGHLTFDCLLNGLDGVERADGILLIVTTNRLERLDAALGIPSSQISTRPGRIDRVLELRNLDETGRHQLCQRILHEWPETWEETVQLGVDETGAQFQERCTQLALAKYWEITDA
jgi:hypothetical protein